MFREATLSTCPVHNRKHIAVMCDDCINEIEYMPKEPICPIHKRPLIEGDCISCRIAGTNTEAPYRQIGGDSQPPRERSDSFVS